MQSLGNNEIFDLTPQEDWIDELDNWHVKEGDNLEWKNNTEFDSTWIKLKNYSIKSTKGNWWIGSIINITDKLNQNKLLGILPDRIVSAAEIYWDGQLIFSNGRIGDTATNEIPGRYFQTISLPKELSSVGIHFTAIRISNWNTNSDWTKGQIFIGYYDSLLKLIFAWQIRISFLIGIIFLATIFTLFLYFASKRRINYLVFSLLCISVLLGLLFNYYWVINPVSNYYLDFKNIAVPICITTTGILFPIFFIYEFELQFNKIILLVTVLNTMLYLIYSGNEKLNEYILYLLIINIILLAVWALIRKKEGSFTVLIGVAASIIFYILDLKFGIDSLTFFSIMLILCYIFSISRKYAKNEKIKNESYIRSIRLENQLLKKNINPHYLMNSLTSIIAWLKREPKTAIKLVEALADEFRIVSQISNLEKIPIKKEMELCETHLKIMSLRKHSDYRIEYCNIDLSDEVPPMIFHTLVENGITHGYEGSKAGKFILSREIIPHGIEYKLYNDSIENVNSEVKIGTGIKYVHARLEESYPQRWRLHSKRIIDGWEVKIEIFEKKL